jgi:hypothetical protein
MLKKEVKGLWGGVGWPTVYGNVFFSFSTRCKRERKGR